MPSEKRQRQRENASARAAAMRAAQRRKANRRRGIIGGLAVVAVVGIIALLINASTGKKSSATSTTVPPTTAPASPSSLSPSSTVATPPTAPPVKGGLTVSGPTPCPKADGSSPRTSQFAQAPPMCIDPTKTYTATFKTSEGAIVVALDTAHVPATVNNFVVLSRYHYYDGSSFDRIDQSIDIIQGGSPTTQSISDPGPGYTIKDEPAAQFKTDASGNLTGPFKYQAGDLVMARGSAANSASAQYFFVVGANGSQLNGQGTYVTFGHVTTGLTILQDIEKNLYEACPSSDQTCLGGAPSRVVLVTSITITEQ